MSRKLRNPATHPFKRGSRVTLNEKFFEWNGDGFYKGKAAQRELFEFKPVRPRLVWVRGVQATVVGFSRVHAPCLWLKADGHPTRACFHPDFLALL
jgi:hypothetical protein